MKARFIFDRCMKLFPSNPNLRVTHRQVGTVWLTCRTSAPQELPYVEFAIPVGNKIFVIRGDINAAARRGREGNCRWIDGEPNDAEYAEMKLLL